MPNPYYAEHIDTSSGLMKIIHNKYEFTFKENICKSQVKEKFLKLKEEDIIIKSKDKGYIEENIANRRLTHV